MISLFPSRQILVTIGGFSIHWYGIMYLLAFVVAYALVRRLQKYKHLQLTPNDWSNILSAIILGVLIGGRLGFVVFYEPVYFLQYPLEIIKVWRGGMSSHGGFIGVLIAVLLVVPKYNISLWKFADIVAVPIAIGLAFGRFGNFINLELYGAQTTVPWGISIPGLVGNYHPTQIYAVCKNLFIAGVCFWHLRKVIQPDGRTFGIFLLLYGLLRFLVEYVRVQQYQALDIGITELTRGQLLTIPVIIIGIILLTVRKRA